MVEEQQRTPQKKKISLLENLQLFFGVNWAKAVFVEYPTYIILLK